MPEIIVAAGTEENIVEDVHILVADWSANPEILYATEKEIPAAVVDHASALFFPDNLILVLIDPVWEKLSELRKQLDILAENIHVIIYATSALPSPLPIQARVITLEKEKKKRIEARVLRFLKKYGKVMTDKGFSIFSERVRDESMLEQELIKLINYSGDRNKIDSKDVRAITTNTHEDSLLTLFQAFSRDQMKEALTIFDNLLSNGLPLLAIQSFLSRQARLLLHAKDIEATQGTRPDYATFQKSFPKWKAALDLKPGEKRHYLLHQKPYYAFKLLQTARSTRSSDLEKLFISLATFDSRVKKGTKHDRVILEAALLKP